MVNLTGSRKKTTFTKILSTRQILAKPSQFHAKSQIESDEKSHGIHAATEMELVETATSAGELGKKTLEIKAASLSWHANYVATKRQMVFQKNTICCKYDLIC